MSSTVGIIGSGSFGVAIAQLLAENTDVLIYSRTLETVQNINQHRFHYNTKLSPRVRATNDVREICESCKILYPVVPSGNFRSMMRTFSPHLRPYHFMIHGTKGFDVIGLDADALDVNNNTPITRAHVRTMSEVIAEESTVVRIGCLAGPNLASEILAGQPAASVIGSRFKEVVDAGKKSFQSKRFHIFGTPEILGAEFAGALKNIIALGSGILGGKGLGKNMQALLITRGLSEMITFGTRLGTSNKAFLGTAGIGDLIATATSSNSRNYTFGMRLAKGETPDQIKATAKEVAEGVRTLQIVHRVARTYKLHMPITDMLYKIVFQNMNVDKAIVYLMEYPYDIDVDFL
jgi:glycerol-3-phosphate dehydrogenase (NAD(P)+)